MTFVKKILLAFSFFAAGLTIWGCTDLIKKTNSSDTSNANNVTSSSSIEKSRYIHSKTPTLFIHGYSGTANSTNQMIAASEKSRAAHKVLTVTIDEDATLHYSGKWNQSIENPIIQVIFTNNRATTALQAKWLNTLLLDLKKTYNCDHFNAVSHSLGCNAVLYQQLTASTEAPRLDKWVPIAGPFNGVIGIDEPEKNMLDAIGKPEVELSYYQNFYALRTHLNSETQILNIFGDLNNKTSSDGDVTTASARSLRYLTSGVVKSYAERLFTGKNVQHSRLHENKKVDTALIKFLWEKE